ncbi:coiled-coil domain-containing protein 17, partial [Pyxicephalus adspersus]|uniref:coiled-coil domain-containing protein 17 n=1 Tax=Pyxicephalus adspersus TaxID=30357 RepID=UPI003B596200
MEDLGSHRCHKCNMIFRSYPMLEKHREKFCIGSQIGDPTVLGSRYVGPRDRTPLLGREVPRQAETPDFKTRESIARLRARENRLNDREQRLICEYDGPLDSISDTKALKSLTEEFHKLRKSLEVSIPPLRSFQGDVLYSQWDREYRDRMMEMAEAHDRQLADIQARNQVLEMQREEIRQRLSEVASSGTSTNHIEQMLLELKAQEEKNQLALHALRDQVTLIQSESRAKAEKMPKEQPASQSVKEKSPLTFLPFAVRGSSLSSEISALQLAYVQSGGSDPAVLAQMRDLQAEALAFEEIAHKQERKEKKKKRHDVVPRALDVELMAVEMENQRLEEEIFNLKLQRSRKKMDKAGSEMAEMQQEHIQQMAQLQADIEMLRRDVSRMPPRGIQGPPPFQPPPLPTLPPQSLHPNRQSIGRAEPAVMMGAQIMLVRPSFSISLVMELQAAGGFNLYGQEVQHLSSCGWTKLDLFDHHNQVLSGRWKLPVRGLPLRPGLSTGQLNTVPQVGKAEIYLRVVNARDAELQAMAEINPRNSSLYQYPPLVPSPAATVPD